MRSNRLTLAIVLTIGILSVSTAAILIRLATTVSGVSDVGFSLVLAASRLSIAALVLVPTWRSFQTASPSATKFAIGAGISLAVHFATWISSLSYTSIAASTTLVTTNPLWVALLSWAWFREKPTRATFWGIGIAMIGGILIGFDQTSRDGSNPLLGNGLAIVGAWAASLYLLLGREAQRQGLNVKSYVTIAYGVAAIVLFPLPFLFGSSYIGYPVLTYVYIALMAVFPQLIGHTSFNWSMRHLPPAIVTLIILLEPVGSTIFAIALFQEIPGTQVIAGALVLLIGVAIAILGNSAKVS
ncbi:DMT family transporter [Leptolyngbya sp. FACHB-17]|uniref:DMT family transporter n=1 Tax=unclassified Leptolyngbya TaxID=2650499 RepID=UPI001680386D|nr:DMT family transporter [Leptolyngbya sp. FACHB-17]MBD2081258.1 DMT family transporter [Leptolyngbya sp. FACHB-17]